MYISNTYVCVEFFFPEILPLHFHRDCDGTITRTKKNRIQGATYCEMENYKREWISLTVWCALVILIGKIIINDALLTPDLCSVK